MEDMNQKTKSSFITELKLTGYAEIGELKVERISEHVYHMDEATKVCPAGMLREEDDPASFNNPSSIYFVEEDNELLMIDCGNLPQTGSGRERDARLIMEAMTAGRSLTIALTHGHGDHVGLMMNPEVMKNIPVKAVYIGKEDLTDAKDLFIFGETACAPYRKVTHTLRHGDTFMIGRHTYTAIGVQAHTLGSILFFEPEQKLCFCGDAIGSGYVWLFWRKQRNPLEIMEESLTEAEKILEKCPDVRLLGGHRWQQFFLGNLNRPEEMDLNYLRDMRQVLAGIHTGASLSIPYDEKEGGITVFRRGCRAMIDTWPEYVDSFRKEQK